MVTSDSVHFPTIFDHDSGAELHLFARPLLAEPRLRMVIVDDDDRETVLDLSEHGAKKLRLSIQRWERSVKELRTRR